MKNKILTFFILITTLSLHAQSRNVQYKNGVFNNNMEFFAMAKVSNKNNSENSIKAKGYYYLNNNWNKCQVKTIKDKDHVFNTCNYNIFDKRFEFIIDNVVYFLKKNEVKHIVINGNKFVPSSFNFPLNKNFFNEIYTFKDNRKLIEIHELKKKSVPSNSTLGLYHNKIEKKSKKYILNENGTLIELPKNKKKILSKLNIKYNSKIHKKLNPKNNNDLIKLIIS